MYLRIPPQLTAHTVQKSNTKKKREKARSTSLLLNYYSTNYSMLARKREENAKSIRTCCAGAGARAGRDEFGLLASLFQYLFRYFRTTTGGQQGTQQGGLLYLFYTTTVDDRNPPEFGPLLSLSGANKEGNSEEELTLVQSEDSS